MRSHSAKTNLLFKVMLVGSTQDKSNIADLLRSQCSDSFSYADCDILSVDNIKFQIWNLAAQDRFNTITSQYYKFAQAIIIFSNDEADFIARLNRVLELVPFESACGIGVVSSDQCVLDKVSEGSLFHINSNNSLNSFFQAVFTASQQKRVLLWQANRIAEYYNQIIRSLTLTLPADNNAGQNNIADLILQYALPYYTTYDRALIQQTDIENQFQALINEAARMEDPQLQIRIYLYYKQAHDFESSIAHLHLVNQYISDISNPFVDAGCMKSICSFLQEEKDEAHNIQALSASYQARQQRVEALHNTAPLPQQGLLFSSPSVVNSIGSLAPDEKVDPQAEMRPGV